MKKQEERRVLGPEGGTEDGFVFSLDGKRTRFSDKELLAEVRGFGETVGGRAFTMAEFNRWAARKCAANCISRRFGTWRRALSLVGISGVKSAEYGAEELIEHLERVWREMGRAPGVRSIRRYGTICGVPYARRWGSLRRACVQLVRWKRGEISREEVLRPCVGRRKGLRPGVRWEVLERGGRTCAVCGRGAGRGVKLEVDHIVPVSAGGGDEVENLRVLCAGCNRGRGSGKSVGKGRTGRRAG